MSDIFQTLRGNDTHLPRFVLAEEKLTCWPAPQAVLGAFVLWVLGTRVRNSNIGANKSKLEARRFLSDWDLRTVLWCECQKPGKHKHDNSGEKPQENEHFSGFFH